MKRLLVLCVLAAWPSSLASAQIVREMSPERIAEAIKIGESSKDKDNPGYYKIQDKSNWGNGPAVGLLSTPFSRVVAAAFEAKRKYKTFTAAEVTPEMTAPEVVVYAPSMIAGRNTTTSRERIANVEAVVILPKGSKDPSKAIQPLRSSELGEEYQNLFGAKFTGKGMIAVFPLDALSESNEIHVVYDQTRVGEGMLKSCKDCAVPFKLDKIR